MVDQTSQFYAILTEIGAAKQANADALGIPWTFAQMAVGDGNPTGLENPPLPMPSASQPALLNEWRRAPLNQLKVDPNNAAVIIAEQIIPADVGGKWIRELSLYDADGDMVAVANCPPTFKPLLSQGSGRTQVVRLNLLIGSSSNVQLKIDPAVVLATREWVTEELAKQDFKHSVVAATTAPIVLSGLQTVDGVVLTVGARVLVKNQLAAKDNGLYLVAAGGVWTRCPDADSSAKVTPGLLVLVERGTVNGDSAWQLLTNAPITLGVTELAFDMAFGRTGVAEGTYRSVTVDKYGRVVAATNPTTVAGYGLTDVYTKTQVDATLASYGIGGAVISTDPNMNNYLVPGNYLTPAAGLLNIPPGWNVSQRHSIVVAGLGPTGHLVQTMVSGLANAVPQMAMRVYTSAPGWSAWIEFWHGGNTPKQTTPTDQTAGAMMTFGSFGLGSGYWSTEPNLNNYKVPGNYITPLGGLSNLPAGWTTGTRYCLTVEGSDANRYLIQRITTGLTQGSVPAVAMRMMQNTDSWTEWYVLPASNTLPFRGTVVVKAAGVTAWAVPDFVKKAWVTVIGGGGGGGFSTSASGIGSAGGGAGGLSQRLVDLTGVTSVSVTVGAGGAGATVSGSGGSSGGTSSFGAYLSATGGAGGGGNSTVGNAPGSGGRGSGGDHNTSLGAGWPNYGLFGGTGGGPGSRATQSAVVGNGALDSGGGGSGAYAGYAGGNGADGCVIIQW